MSVVVSATGPLLLVEDLGRTGFAHLGVPPSGALDPAALSLANRLVGNVETAAGLEALLGGVRLTVEDSSRLAVTGAQLPLTVQGRAMPWGQAVSVRAGETVELGRAPRGLRSWVAFAGGIDVPQVLGSRSTDVLTGLGPPALRVGDRLCLGEPPASTPAASAVPMPMSAEVVTLKMVLGPRDDWFTPAAVEQLFADEYAVSSAADRTALRLEGAALERRHDGELASEGLVTGAVQVPASGQPLVFLADHPVTGGYPVLGVVDRGSLRRCAQLRPGDRVRFQQVRQGAPRWAGPGR